LSKADDLEGAGIVFPGNSSDETLERILAVVVLADIFGKLGRAGLPADGLTVVGPAFKTGNSLSKKTDADLAVNLGWVDEPTARGRYLLSQYFGFGY
jgi:hypothetical protein